MKGYRKWNAMSEPISTCSVASGDLPLPHNGQDTERSLFASETSSAKPSLKSIGRKSPATKTFANLTAGNTEASIYSQGDFLASHSVSPGSAEARRMTVISGRKCCGLLRRQDRVGLLARTLLELSTWNSTVVFLTWKVRVTPSKRLLFQLAPSIPSTDGIESGLWPTPQTLDHIEMTRPVVMRGRSPRIVSNNGIEGQAGLRDAVKFWPTPSASEDAAGTVNGQMQYMLTHAAKESEAQAGQLNPQWVEWLMGYPPEWTALSPSEMQSFRKSRLRSSKRSTQLKHKVPECNPDPSV